jgi:hypothetical protein
MHLVPSAASANPACTLGIVCVPANCPGKVDALGTFAGRLGFALDRVLLYGKGGTAFANDKYEINSLTASRSNETRWGWMVGAGIEYSFSDNRSAKIEYNYIDFGTRPGRRCAWPDSQIGSALSSWPLPCHRYQEPELLGARAVRGGQGRQAAPSPCHA